MRKLWVLVGADGEPVEAAGCAPFDGTREEAGAEVVKTLGEWRSNWALCPLTAELEEKLKEMARAVGLEDAGGNESAAPDA